MFEKEFYRLPELAKRWDCTVEDLLHLGITYRAQVCVNIYGIATDEQVKFIVRYIEIAPWASESADDMPPGIYELSPNDLRSLEVFDSSVHELHQAMSIAFRSWAESTFDPPVSINRGNLCMLHAEVNRLEQEIFRVIAGDDSKAPAQSESGHIHKTYLMEAMDEARRYFWDRYDGEDISGAQTNETVAEWLLKNYGPDSGRPRSERMSRRIAEAIATILRPDDLRTGPR